jgi:hypothetical protein
MRTWLTGVGAMTLASAVVFAVVFELRSDGILHLPGSRPEFEIVGLPAYAFGAAVAVAAGGWRGVLALVVLASLWVVTVPFIPGADHEFFLRQLWSYEGIVLGVLIAAVRPARVSSAALVGAGVYGAVIAANGVRPSVITQQAACQSDTVGLCVAVYSLLSVLLSIVGGAAAGLVVGGRISFVSATLLALILALPSAVILAHQGWMWQYSGLPSLLGMASGVAGGLALVVAAAIARGFTHRRARTEAMA